VLLAKPETFMNLSGLSVRELVDEYQADPAKDLLVIYDELDLPLGAIRVRKQGSAAGHNGMKSILGALGSQEVQRIRLGVAPDHEVGDGARYVLGAFRKPQYPLIDAMLDTTAKAVQKILTEGVDAAMNEFNRRPDPPECEAT
jgi:peptidyl-tRNA hydrolase, PTH1 family